MPGTAGPYSLGDLLNAETAMRDRARYLKAGTFNWAGAGTTGGGPGILLGWAPGGTSGYSNPRNAVEISGTYSVDGGSAQTVYGSGTVAINRYFAGSFNISRGVAWYLTFPAKKPLGYAGILDAIDRYHRDGAVATGNYANGSVGGTNNALTTAGSLLSVSGAAGILLSLSGMGAWDGSNPGTILVGLDVYTEGAHRFRCMTPMAATASGQSDGTAFSSGVGLIRYASSLAINVLYAASGNGNGRLYASAQYVHGV